MKRSTQATAISAWPMLLAEPVRRLDRGALLFQHLEHARYLRLAALDPEIELLVLAQHALVQQADALVAEPHRQRANPQDAAAASRRAARSSPCPGRPGRRDNPGSSRSRSAPRRRRAPASAPAAADYRARSCRHRRRSTTACARRRGHRAACAMATRRTKGESYWPIRIIDVDHLSRRHSSCHRAVAPRESAVSSTLRLLI